MRRRGGELGRIEHDRVEGAALLAELAQRGIHVGIQEVGARGVKTVERHVARAACSRAGPEESMEVTCAAPPAKAATVKPPV